MNEACTALIRNSPCSIEELRSLRTTAHHPSRVGADRGADGITRPGAIHRSITLLPSRRASCRLLPRPFQRVPRGEATDDSHDTRPAQDSRHEHRARARIRAHGCHRSDHGKHHRRRCVQSPDLARDLWSDQSRLDGPDHRRSTRAGPSLRGALAAIAGRRRPLRVLACRLRESIGIRQRVVLLDHGVGRKCSHCCGLGPLCRGVRQ